MQGTHSVVGLVSATKPAPPHTQVPGLLADIVAVVALQVTHWFAPDPEQVVQLA